METPATAVFHVPLEMAAVTRGQKGNSDKTVAPLKAMTSSDAKYRQRVPREENRPESTSHNNGPLKIAVLLTNIVHKMWSIKCSQHNSSLVRASAVS